MLKIVSSKLDALRNKVSSMRIPQNRVTVKYTDPMLASQHWILDGFPRTVNQGKLLDVHLRSASLYFLPLALSPYL